MIRRGLPILALAVLAFPAHAASLAGHYYLEGVMETGSELLLRPNGSFDWYLSYGALDLLAQGDWREDKGHILLMTKRKQTNAPEGEPQAFEKLDMTISATSGNDAALETDLWARHVIYVRHEPANSGH